MKFKANEDPLVYPEEYKCGMKEEMEHSETVGGDKEKIKKIVIDHLKEDPKYYSKLSTKMKAEKVPRAVPGTVGPKLRDYLKERKLLAEEDKKPREIPGKAAPKTREYLKERKLLAEEKEPFTPHSHSPGQTSYMPPLGLQKPKSPAPKHESELPSERLSAEDKLIPHYKPSKQSEGYKMTPKEEVETKLHLVPKKAEECVDCGKKLSTQLIKKAEEELGKDKVSETKNKTIVEKFSEEVAKPAVFKAPDERK